MKNSIKYILFFVLLITINACKKGFEGDYKNRPLPETFMAVNKIERIGENRLTTRVDAYWWGTSESGYIVGYELSIDSMRSWTYTTRLDSVILLTIPFGSDTADVNIYVRAIDNLGQKDLTPASLSYPVKNSKPTIVNSYIPGKKPIKSFPAVRFFWTATDNDGPQDINGFEIYLNDSILVNGSDTVKTIYTLASNVNDVSIVADSVFSNDCFVYTGTRTKPLDARIKGIKYDVWNYFYVRAFDKAGSKSDFIKDSIIIKKPKSKVLFVNGYLTARNLPFNFIASRISSFAPVLDTLLINDYNASLRSLTEQSSDELTQSRVFSFFSKIIWISDEGATANTLALAQQSTDAFFNNGGTMFMMCNFGSDFPITSPYFGFTPIQEMVNTNGAIIRMNIDALMTPRESSWPTLKASSIISSPRPFLTPLIPSGTNAYDSLYNASLIVQGSSGVSPWTGRSNVMSKRVSLKDNKTILLFLSVPIQLLNGNGNANLFLEKALKTELRF